MKQERKESLLCAFPPVPSTLMEQMNKKAKKSVGNFAVMLTNGNELFVRCYHHYYDEAVLEFVVEAVVQAVLNYINHDELPKELKTAAVALPYSNDSFSVSITEAGSHYIRITTSGEPVTFTVTAEKI